MRTLSIIIRSIGDILFPPSPDRVLVERANGRDLALLVTVRDIRGVRTLLPFHVALVRAAIHEAKFHGNKRAFALLGAALHEHLVSFSKNDYTLIPIPLSGSRTRERGYNQAAEIAKAALSELPHMQLREDALQRTRNTKPQTKLPREARIVNMENAFAVAKPGEVRGRHIILVDDVATTGATLAAAKAALLRHSPASVTCIALAH